MFKHFPMIEERTTCGSCENKFAGVNGKEMRKPRFSPCIHTFCTECLLAEEAKAQQGGSVAEGVGERAQGKKRKIDTCTPCMYCGHASSVPVAELMLHVGLMKRVDAEDAAGGGGGGAGAAVGAADEATPASATFDALFAEMEVVCDDATAAATVNKIIRGELEGSRDAALKVKDDALNRLARGVHQRKGEMKLRSRG